MRKIALVRQSEAAECGLACLAMVCGAHGADVPLAELRRRHPPSLKGMSLEWMISVAAELGLRSRPIRAELDALGDVRVPAILHWNMSHFVVLESIGARGALIHDPARGTLRVDRRALSRSFTGVALELEPGDSLASLPATGTPGLLRAISRIRGIRRSLALALSLSLSLQLFVLAAPFYMQLMVDRVLRDGDRGLATVLAAGFGLAMLLQAAIGWLRGWVVAYLSSQLGYQWTNNVFTRLVRLPLVFFQNRHLGDVLSRLDSVQAIQRTMTTSFVEALIDGLLGAVTFAMMCWYSGKLALVTLLAISAYAGWRYFSFAPLRTATEERLNASATQQSHLLESIRGIQSVRIAGAEAVRGAEYANRVSSTVDDTFRVARLELLFAAGNQVIFGAERILVVFVGALLVMAGSFSVGMLVAYLAYKDQFAARVGSLIDKGIEFRMLRLYGERLADIMREPPEEDSPEPGVPAPSAPSVALEARGLCFRYAEDEPWIVHDCSFAVTPGETVAIVGASGCGKSTLVRLLLGLYTPSRGTVAVDGVDIRRLGLRNFRAMVGVVMQDDELFAGSVAENIAFGTGRFDMARVEEAARLASIHDDIVAGPMGYHALIGDMGTTLSGGQKQRIILARALYRRPKLLVLDEATSHLDVLNERLVNARLRELRITKVVVAHRPETIASADRVLVMQQGRLLERPARPQPMPQAMAEPA